MLSFRPHAYEKLALEVVSDDTEIMLKRDVQYRHAWVTSDADELGAHDARLHPYACSRNCRLRLAEVADDATDVTSASGKDDQDEEDDWGEVDQDKDDDQEEDASVTLEPAGLAAAVGHDADRSGEPVHFFQEKRNTVCDPEAKADDDDTIGKKGQTSPTPISRAYSQAARDNQDQNLVQSYTVLVPGGRFARAFPVLAKLEQRALSSGRFTSSGSPLLLTYVWLSLLNYGHYYCCCFVSKRLLVS